MRLRPQPGKCCNFEVRDLEERENKRRIVSSFALAFKRKRRGEGEREISLARQTCHSPPLATALHHHRRYFAFREHPITADWQIFRRESKRDRCAAPDTARFAWARSAHCRNKTPIATTNSHFQYSQQTSHRSSSLLSPQPSTPLHRMAVDRHRLLSQVNWPFGQDVAAKEKATSDERLSLRNDYRLGAAGGKRGLLLTRSLQIECRRLSAISAELTRACRHFDMDKIGLMIVIVSEVSAATRGSNYCAEQQIHVRLPFLSANF